jgi:chemotaxis methyl-accepting protein methylase
VRRIQLVQQVKSISIAMLLLELKTIQQITFFKIFASDLSIEAINLARIGEFCPSIGKCFSRKIAAIFYQN